MWPHKPHHYVKVGIPSEGIKTIRIIKAAPTYFGSHKAIIREPQPVLS
jgi:hypothetical protein